MYSMDAIAPHTRAGAQKMGGTAQAMHSHYAYCGTAHSGRNL